MRDVKTAMRVPLRAVNLLVLLSTLLAGCSNGQSPAGKDQDAADRAAAEQKLQQMLAVKQQAQAEQNRAQAAAEERAAAAQAEAARPHYSPAIVAAAARPRKWAHIHVENTGIDAVLNTTWVNNTLNYRVALLGERSDLERFTTQWNEFRVNFNNQSGMPTYDFAINPSDFQWDPPSTNGGIPTMETRGTAPCELPEYQTGVQWNLTWN